MNHNERATCVTSVGSVGVFDRSPFDGGRRGNLGRRSYRYCNCDRDSRNRDNSARTQKNGEVTENWRMIP